MRISEKYNWRKLSPDDGNFFFGYYDRNPWNEDNSKHLALKAPQCERLPLPGETAEAGYIEKNTGEFIKCAETRAWCHQQGATQQWLKHLSDTFIFNDYDVRKQSLVCRVYQIGKGIIGQYDLPVYVLSPDGNWGIYLNFSRIPRRGYSYADVPVPDNRHPDSDNDGLFLMDMRTGKSKLIVSYADIIEKYPIQYELAERYWWLNHPGFNNRVALQCHKRGQKSNHPKDNPGTKCRSTDEKSHPYLYLSRKCFFHAAFLGSSYRIPLLCREDKP